MQMPETDLLGDSISNPTNLPTGERFTDLDQLVGHTIIGAFDVNTGARASDQVVLVTATKCWIVLEAENDEDDCYIDVKTQGYRASTLDAFVHLDQLLESGCINGAEHAALTAVEHKRTQEANEKRAAHLRAELAKLEGQALPATAGAASA